MEFAYVSSPIGWLKIGVRDGELCSLTKTKKPKSNPKVSNAVLLKAKKQLVDYFAGRKKAFDFPIHQAGTEFQQNVWRQLQQIPFGETRTYGQIATAVGKPKAARAVGSACGKNPLLLVVPCHRVVASNGNLGGFALGLPVKKRLLNLEQQKK